MYGKDKTRTTLPTEWTNDEKRRSRKSGGVRRMSAFLLIEYAVSTGPLVSAPTLQPQIYWIVAVDDRYREVYASACMIWIKARLDLGSSWL